MPTCQSLFSTWCRADKHIRAALREEIYNLPIGNFARFVAAPRRRTKIEFWVSGGQFSVRRLHMGSDADNHIPSIRLTDANSFLLSAICHLLGLVVLALFTVASFENGHLALWLNVKDGADTLLNDDLGGGTFELVKHTTSFNSQSLELLSNSTTPVELATSDASLFSESLRADRLGDLRGQASGIGDGLGAEFFGIGGQGATFVYVIDCSGSMLDMKKFQRAKAELMRSIRGLKSNQKFYIILYSDGAYPMDADEPLPATSEHIAKTEEWLDLVRPDGGTNPLSALLFAVSLKPSAIYFLSDGKFDLSVASELRIKNRQRRKRIPIHTIAFYNRETEGLMKMIARNSGGIYQFVK